MRALALILLAAGLLPQAVGQAGMERHREMLLQRVVAAGGGGGGIAEVSSRRASGSGSGVDSANLAFPGNVTSGDLLVVAGAMWGASNVPTGVAVTDSQGNTYTVLLGDTIPTLTWRTFIAYTKAGSSAACTVTVNPAGVDSTHSFSWSIDEFSGTAASPFDTQDSGEAGNDLNPTGAVVGGTAGKLIIGVMSQEGPDRTLTAISGTTFGENESNTSMQCHNAVFRVLGSSSGFEVWSMSDPSMSDDRWGAQTATFTP